MTLLRHRGTLVGIAFIWGILWAVSAMIAGTIIAVIDPAQIDPGEAPIVLALLNPGVSGKPRIEDGHSLRRCRIRQSF